MDFIYQLIHVASGDRSEAIYAESREQLALDLSLHKAIRFEDRDKYAVLVLIEWMKDSDPSTEWNYSKAPFMLVDTFINLFCIGERDHV